MAYGNHTIGKPLYHSDCNQNVPGTVQYRLAYDAHRCNRIRYSNPYPLRCFSKGFEQGLSGASAGMKE